MCHWALRVWKCGDSYFTKHSSCSFDRAMHDPTSPLNPLHPSIKPIVASDHESHAGANPNSSLSKNPEKIVNENSTRGTRKRRPKNKARSSTKPHETSAMPTPCLPGPVFSTSESSLLSSPRATQASSSSKDVYARDALTGKTIPIPLSEIGKASRFGDKTLGKVEKCNVFEVVLQTKETSMCPACARSPKRAQLPAHARGCFGLS